MQQQWGVAGVGPHPQLCRPACAGRESKMQTAGEFEGEWGGLRPPGRVGEAAGMVHGHVRGNRGTQEDETHKRHCQRQH